jgi:hypothetical protein
VCTKMCRPHPLLALAKLPRNRQRTACARLEGQFRRQKKED